MVKDFLNPGGKPMSDPYRSEDQVAKLQAENEKLQREKDELTARFGLLKKWPRTAAYLAIGAMAVVFGVFISVRSPASSAPAASDETVAREVSPAPPARVLPRRVKDARAQKIYRDCMEENSRRLFTDDTIFSGFLNLDDPYPVEGGFESWDDDKRFIFCALAGETIIFRMKSILGTGIDPELTLLNDGGDELASDDNSGEGNDAALVFTFKKSGRYILKLEAGWTMFWEADDGAYRLSARRL